MQMLLADEKPTHLWKLHDDWKATFDLNRFDSARRPIMVGRAYGVILPANVNHYLIGSPGSPTYDYGYVDSVVPQGFASVASYELRQAGISTADRYCYLTMQTALVKAGETMRVPGWHTDDLQGDEVPVKQPGAAIFIWSDVLPTVFACHPFEMADVDLSKDNAFRCMAEQIQPWTGTETKPGGFYAMGPYHVHRGQVAQVDTKRQFLRLVYTTVPVTSTKMTFNPAAYYDYPIHSTTGTIPAHLV